MYFCIMKGRYTKEKLVFFFQAEDGIRGATVTGVQTCALPISGVWVGYDKPKSLGKEETGGRVAVPIWTAFMKEALQGTTVEDFPLPEGVVMVPVDLSPAGYCVKPVMMAFIAGTEPRNNCDPGHRSPAPDAPATPAPPPTGPPIEAATVAAPTAAAAPLKPPTQGQ